jgi:hypothetical protein
MDQHIAALFLLDETALTGIFVLLFVGGAVLAACILKIRTPLRRTSYLWFLALAHLALTLSFLGWGLAPSAANAGLLWLLVIGMMTCLLILGMAYYWGAAARSVHIRGDTRRAWFAFVIFANLWLVFKPGRDAGGSGGGRLARAARRTADSLLVLGAFLVFIFS